MKIQKIWAPPVIHETDNNSSCPDHLVATLCGKWVSVDDYKVIPEGTEVTCKKCLNQTNIRGVK